MPAHVMTKRDGKGSYERMAQENEIVRRRTNGEPMFVIARDMGLPLSTAKRRFKKGLARELAPNVERLRAEQNAKLDNLMQDWVTYATTAGDLYESAKAAEKFDVMDRAVRHVAESLNGQLRVVERRARLNGLDAPIKTDVTVTVQDETDRAIADLNERLMRRREPVTG